MAPARPVTARCPSRPLAGRAIVPGDRSISQRALMLGALAVGLTRIEGLLEGEDVLRTAAAMRALGAATEQESSVWQVMGRGVGGLAEPDDVLDIGGSGMAGPLLAGMLASHDLRAVMTGDANLRRRATCRVTEPLALCGARFVSREDGRLPLSIQGAADAMPIRYRVPVASAQLKSAILLAGLNARGQTEVWEATATHDHSENMLRRFGAAVLVEADGAGRRVTLAGQPELRAQHVVVPADPSFASFPLVAALLVPGSAITLPRVGLNPLRTGLLTTLREMGADIRVTAERTEGGEAVGDLTVRHGDLRAADVPPGRAPAMIEDYPVLAVAAAFARGTTRMRGLAGLRATESKRLEAVAAMLQAAGAGVAIEGNDLLVHGSGRLPGGCTVRTHMDRWLAMSALVLGQGADASVVVDDAACIEASFPGFRGLMRGLGADIT